MTHVSLALLCVWCVMWGAEAGAQPGTGRLTFPIGRADN
jgi:hypothetical protein